MDEIEAKRNETGLQDELLAYEISGRIKMREKISTKYWNEYYSFWDNFVANWFRERGNKSNVEPDYVTIARAYTNAVAELNFDELPTPFLGMPHKGVDAVIINLNPGLSEKIGFGRFAGSNSDATQFYSHIGDEIGWLIRKFVDEAEGSYRRFVGIDSDINYSCLNPNLLDIVTYPDWVCGVNWWQGYDKKLIENGYRGKCFRNRDKRMPWLRQIYNKKISPAKVFALELCPFHSKNFSLNKRDKDLCEFIRQHVIIPAATAVVENELPFAVAIGKTTADILDTEIGTSHDIWSYDMQLNGWPVNDGLRRTYKLYDVKSQDGRIAHILVTWAKNNQGIPSPKAEFADFEKLIYTQCFDNENLVGKGSREAIRSLEAVSSQVEAQKSKRTIVPIQDRKSLYDNLWGKFFSWCKENNKTWFSQEVKFEENYIKPSGTRKPCVLFKIDRHGQLYLGIYCAKDSVAEIRRKCTNCFTRIFTDVNWGKQENDRDITIQFPVAGDWRNPNDVLFQMMAEKFEAVRGILREKGLLRVNDRVAKRR